jgi:hypothetical protein
LIISDTGAANLGAFRASLTQEIIELSVRALALRGVDTISCAGQTVVRGSLTSLALKLAV